MKPNMVFPLICLLVIDCISLGQTSSGTAPDQGSASQLFASYLKYNASSQNSHPKELSVALKEPYLKLSNNFQRFILNVFDINGLLPKFRGNWMKIISGAEDFFPTEEVDRLRNFAVKTDNIAHLVIGQKTIQRMKDLESAESDDEPEEKSYNSSGLP
eukprot:52770_1